jgi:hypothetical protein
MKPDNRGCDVGRLQEFGSFSSRVKDTAISEFFGHVVCFQVRAAGQDSAARREPKGAMYRAPLSVVKSNQQDISGGFRTHEE